MSLLDQIEKSNLSKKGLTNPTGQFEGTPANVATVLRSSDTLKAAAVVPPSQVPIDVVFDPGTQPTYLEYIQASTKR